MFHLLLAYSYRLCLPCFGYFLPVYFVTNLSLSAVAPMATIGKSVSDATKVSKQIFMTKSITLPEKNTYTIIVASKFGDENGSVSASTRIWSNYMYFNQHPMGFNMKKVNYPENSIIYVNQAYLTVNNNKRIYYADFF